MAVVIWGLMVEHLAKASFVATLMAEFIAICIIFGVRNATPDVVVEATFDPCDNLRKV